jgi:hypothetical protein
MHERNSVVNFTPFVLAGILVVKRCDLVDLFVFLGISVTANDCVSRCWQYDAVIAIMACLLSRTSSRC